MRYCTSCGKNENSIGLDGELFYRAEYNYFTCCAMDGTYRMNPDLVSKVKFFVLGWILMAMIACALYLYKVPACHEDSTIIGSGQFARGRWTTYTCGPAVDDYVK